MSRFIQGIMLIVFLVSQTLVFYFVFVNEPKEEPPQYEPTEFVEDFVLAYHTLDNVERDSEVAEPNPIIKDSALMIMFDPDEELLGVFAIHNNEMLIIEYSLSKTITGRMRLHFKAMTYYTNGVIYDASIPWDEEAEPYTLDIREADFEEALKEMTAEDWLYIAKETR